MLLHIFNPEHDLALAANLANFTAPHAGRQLRKDLGFLPALWAGSDDCVLVEDVPFAEKSFQRLMHRPFCRFVEKQEIGRLPLKGIVPWGWDLALHAWLGRMGIDAALLPSERTMTEIRELSHRRYAMLLSRHLQQSGTTGEALFLETPDMVVRQLEQWPRMVIKAPWSSSGRGVRFVDRSFSPQQRGWLDHVIRQQGGVMAEPYYAKVKDFGMEFLSDGKGCVTYCGLSLFHTSNGAYTGNVLADESRKLEIITRYIAVDLIENVKSMICHSLGLLLCHRYQGPLGVDMMIVTRDDQHGFLLHPCVEINLRRTMGHVALSLPPSPSGFPHVMSIVYNENSYKIKIRKL